MIPLAGLGSFQGQRLEPIAKNVTVTLGAEQSFDIPQDRVFKNFLAVYEWVVTPTFASGSPKLHRRGVTHALTKKLEVSRSAGDVLKVFRGIAQLQDQERWNEGENCPTVYQTNSSTLGAAAVQADAPALGATTQPVAIREAYMIALENRVSSSMFETLLNTKGLNTGKIRITHGAAADVQDPNDSTTVSFTVTGKLWIYGNTADHLIDNVAFDDWRQNYDEVSFGTITQNRTIVELKPQGQLQGFHLRAFKGSKDESLTFEEMKNFEVKVEYNGNFLFDGNMADFASLNGCKGSLRKFFESSAYLNILNNKTYDTGLDTVQGGAFRPLRLTVSTPSSLSGTAVKLVAEYDLIEKR